MKLQHPDGNPAPLCRFTPYNREDASDRVAGYAPTSEILRMLAVYFQGGPVKFGYLAVALLLCGGTLLQAQQNQQVPDAPSTTAQDTTAPSPQQPGGTPPGSLTLPGLLQGVTPGRGTTSSSTDGSTATDQQQKPTDSVPPASQPQSTTPPPEQPTPGTGSSSAAYTLRVRTNFVLVPVIVKDSKGHLVPGLTWRDFKVFEDGVQQQLNFFTVDPFPLSVAFVIDQSLPEDTMKKVNDALSALQGAFTPYDEIAVYTYASHVTQATGFTGAQSERLTAVLGHVKAPGRDMQVPGGYGPLAEGPVINGRAIDPNTTPMHNGSYIPIIQHDVHTLNDAILEAANGLSQRGKGRRRLVYVISDGKENGSTASYKEVIRYLLANQIAVYGTLVGDSATPVLGFLDKYHLPLLGTDNILPKYTTASGGQLDAEFSRDGIERSFAKIAEEVRTQYTLGYNSHRSVFDSRYRSIEVQVLRPNLSVVSKQGYYPTATSMR
ncbi:MAG TPA: VWA domain-containing protein [Acidobacteriaceae bacterium]|nr:VWA domain-containing protein [Acidobacteriaceae bacterium]